MIKTEYYCSCGAHIGQSFGAIPNEQAPILLRVHRDILEVAGVDNGNHLEVVVRTNDGDSHIVYKESDQNVQPIFQALYSELV